MGITLTYDGFLLKLNGLASAVVDYSITSLSFSRAFLNPTTVNPSPSIPIGFFLTN